MYSPYESCWRLLREFNLLTIKDIYRRLDEGAEDREIARMLKMHPSSWSRIKPFVVRTIHVPSDVMLEVMKKENDAREYDTAEVHKMVDDSQNKLRLIHANDEPVSGKQHRRA